MQKTVKKLWERVALVLGTGLGVGYVPIAPGTFGSLWGLALAWALLEFELHPAVYSAIAVVIALFAIPICGRAAASLGKSDPGSVVFDEIAAFPIVFFPLNLLATPFDLTAAVAGFVWFRLFDILKPWPIRHIEKLRGGLGVAADDLLAGVYAAIALWFTVWLL